MADFLVRATDTGGQIRALVASTTATVQEGCQRHGTLPVASAALGRALTAGALLGAGLKGGERITLRIHGDGPLGHIIVDADEEPTVRGYVHHPQVDLAPTAAGKLDVGTAVGRGMLYITRDLGMKEMYTGSSPLVSGEIGDDLSQYYWDSEQVPTAVGLGVLVNPDGSIRAAGGYMVQAMPGADDEDRRQLEQNLRRLGAVSNAVDAGQSPEDMLATALAGFSYEILARQPVSFRCRCSRERARSIIAGLGQAEVATLDTDGHGAELRCEFCGETFRFDRCEVAEMLARIRAPRVDPGQ